MNKNDNKKLERNKYYVEREGLETGLYQVEDVNYAKNCYGIYPNEIIELDGEELSHLVYKEEASGRRCFFGNLCNLDNIVIAEKRLGKNIRNLQIDTKIESVLENFRNMPYEERDKIADKLGVANYEGCEIYSEITEYARKKGISTITVSSVALFSHAVGSEKEGINVLKNLRRDGIHIYFKNDGLWTGKPIHDMDIGAILVLAWCTTAKDYYPDEKDD